MTNVSLLVWVQIPTILIASSVPFKPWLQNVGTVEIESSDMAWKVPVFSIAQHTAQEMKAIQRQEIDFKDGGMAGPIPTLPNELASRKVNNSG